MDNIRTCAFCNMEGEFIWQGDLYCYFCLAEQLIKEALSSGEADGLTD